MPSFPNRRHLADEDSPRKPPSVIGAHEGAGDMPAPRQVLIVEDEFLLALSIEEMVQQMGYAVCDCVATGRSAVRAAETHRPDIVLMDIRLAQGGDGIDTAKAIRTAFGIRSIFISAHTDPATVRRMREADPVGFLAKPCEPALLAAMLEKAFDPIN